MPKIVYLVGAGPGDEDLITLKAFNCIKKADVIVYDNLVNDNLLLHAPENTEIIYAGKKVNQHTLKQEEINQLLVDKANEEKVVVRLKGGDPFVFGRGGEEAIALKENNIPFEIVPGISSSITALAYAGIPITHRAISTSFHVITGHEDPTKEGESVNYELLAQLQGTLVFLMGLNNLPKITSLLLKCGKPPETPVAVISKGTTVNQKVAIGTLENIEQKLDGITYPAIITVGEVINLREYVQWFEKKPLFGRKILVTRARHQASVLSQKIKELGGCAVEFPTIEIEPVESHFDDFNKYQWLVFTSVNSVEIFFEKLIKDHGDVRAIGDVKICAIGEATKQAVEKFHLKVEVTPTEYVAEKLAEELKQVVKQGDNILIPRAEVAREVLPEQLREMGANVDVVPLYKTILPQKSDAELADILKGIDTITFASSSTVKNFIEILGKNNLNLLKGIKIACIGPITAETVKEYLLPVDIIPEDYTIEGLVNVL